MRSSRPLETYVITLSVAGLMALAALMTLPSTYGTATEQLPLLGLFTLFVVVGELVPITLHRRGQAVELSTATTFAFALALALGPGPAAVVLAVGSAVSDLVRRKALSRVAFNAAQYTLAIAAAGWVYQTLAAGRPLAQALLPAALAGIVFFVLNLLFVNVAVALAQGTRLLPTLREELWFEVWTSAMLLSLAPVAVLIAAEQLVLVPVLVLPLAALHMASRGATRAHERRAEAEADAARARRIAEDQRRLAVAEQALVEELQAADRIKADLLASVSHELRSPLTTMLGSLRTIQARGDALPEEHRSELVDLGVKQGERLHRLIEQLLTAAQSGDGRPHETARRAIDVAKLVRDVGTRAREQHTDRPVAIATVETLVVRADPESVGQVLATLVDNACRYSPSDGPVRLSATRSGPLAVIAVEDAGHGIDRSRRTRIFERFGKLQDRIEPSVGGLGLDLYIARTLARRQGGELAVGDSPALGGARFELRLPLAEPPQVSLPGHPTTAARNAAC